MADVPAITKSAGVKDPSLNIGAVENERKMAWIAAVQPHVIRRWRSESAVVVLSAMCQTKGWATKRR